MAAPDLIQNVWNWNKIPDDPMDMRFNKFPETQTTLFKPTGKLFKDQEKKDAMFLHEYQNVRRKDGKSILCQRKRLEWERHVQQSKFFSRSNDMEKKEKKNLTKIEIKNPEFLLSKMNDKEVDMNIEDKNSINKRVMVDTGRASFSYDPPRDTQVGVVRQSNQSFLQRRDRFFVPPRPPAPAVNKKKTEKEIMAEALKDFTFNRPPFKSASFGGKKI